MPASKIYKQQQQQLLPAGPDVELDARLKYWINSVPLPSCALVRETDCGLQWIHLFEKQTSIIISHLI